MELDLAPLTWIFDEALQTAVAALSVTIDGEAWIEVEDFVDSESASRHFRVSTDNEGFITIHFGDGLRGAPPLAGSQIEVRYRAGLGGSGDVDAGRLNVFDAA